MNRFAFYDQLAGFFMILEIVLFKSSLDLILLWTSIFCPIWDCVECTTSFNVQQLGSRPNQV